MKQYLAIFLVCFLCLFFLVSGLFGVNGYFYNQDLKRQIRVAEYNRDKLDIDINNLQDQKTHLASEEGLRDLAIDLGYYVDGDTVYLFDEPSLQSNDFEKYSITDHNSYKALSSSTVLLIDFGSSLVISFIIWLLSRNKTSHNDYYSGDDIPDQDIYINA